MLVAPNPRCLKLDICTLIFSLTLHISTIYNIDYFEDVFLM